MTEQEAIKNINTYIYSELESIPKQLLKSLKLACFTLKEVQRYRAVGTPEECRAAVERQIPKKPVEMKPTDKLLNGYFACPMCGGWVGMDEYSNEYCGCCGQKINWSDNN